MVDTVSVSLVLDRYISRRQPAFTMPLEGLHRLNLRPTMLRSLVTAGLLAGFGPLAQASNGLPSRLCFTAQGTFPVASVPTVTTRSTVTFEVRSLAATSYSTRLTARPSYSGARQALRCTLRRIRLRQRLLLRLAVAMYGHEQSQRALQLLLSRARSTLPLPPSARSR